MVMVSCPQASSQALNRKQIRHLYCLELFSTEQCASVTFNLTFLVQNSLGFLIVVTLYAIEMLGLDIKLSIDKLCNVSGLRSYLLSCAANLQLSGCVI